MIHHLTRVPSAGYTHSPWSAPVLAELRGNAVPSGESTGYRHNAWTERVFDSSVPNVPNWKSFLIGKYDVDTLRSVNMRARVCVTNFYWVHWVQHP